MYEINHLNLITSSICDLKCSYCFLHKDKAFRKQDKKIVQAWEDGTYVKNIKEVFNRLESNPNNVSHISFWGGEPFIHIKEIIPSIKELNKFFPKVEIYQVPTNWAHTNISELCDLLQAINDTSIPRTKENLIRFHIQASIDGIDNDIFTKEGHQVSWERYKKNFDDLYDRMEEMNLPNLSIDLCISSTGNLSTILNRFSKQENVEEHIQFWDKAIRYIQEKVKKMSNPEMVINTLINFPTVAIPVQSSIKDGLDLVSFARFANYLLYKNNAIYKQQDSIIRDYYNCESNLPIAGANYECPEANQGGVTLYYDGTICQCPDGFLENLKEFQDEFLEKEDYRNFKITKIMGTHFFNPLTATQKDIDDHRWYTVLGGFKDTYFPYMNLQYALATELALSRQIDYTYYQDPFKLLSHLNSATMMNECFREAVNMTGIPYLDGHDVIRRWLNGWVDMARNAHSAELKNFMTRCVKAKKKIMLEEGQQ